MAKTTPEASPIVEEVKTKEPQVYAYMCRYACTKTFRRRVFIPASMATSRFDIPAIRLAFEDGYLSVTEATADQFLALDGSRRLTLPELVQLIESHDDFRRTPNGKGDFVKVAGPGLKLSDAEKKYISELTAFYEKRKTEIETGPRTLRR